MADIGLSFSPSQQSNQNRPDQGPTNPTQDAIQLLSLRLPSVLGASAISPLELMAGGGTNALSSEALRRFLSSLFPNLGRAVVGGQPGTVPGGAPGSAPVPMPPGASSPPVHISPGSTAPGTSSPNPPPLAVPTSTPAAPVTRPDDFRDWNRGGGRSF